MPGARAPGLVGRPGPRAVGFTGEIDESGPGVGEGGRVFGPAVGALDGLVIVTAIRPGVGGRTYEPSPSPGSRASSLGVESGSRHEAPGGRHAGRRSRSAAGRRRATPLSPTGR